MSPVFFYVESCSAVCKLSYPILCPERLSFFLSSRLGFSSSKCDVLCHISACIKSARARNKAGFRPLFLLPVNVETWDLEQMIFSFIPKSHKNFEVLAPI